MNLTLPLPFERAALGADASMGPDAMHLHGFAACLVGELVAAVACIEASSPFRHMRTRGGYPLSGAMTNCGELGWVTDAAGYRYAASDPQTGLPWPVMPKVFRDLATGAAAAAGFADFQTDACLVNRYVGGSRMALHRDQDERDLRQPIVSVSLGLPATFLWGGLRRADRTRSIALRSGDVVVWGGGSRLNYHGVKKLACGSHPLTGEFRLNLTFRRAR